MKALSDCCFITREWLTLCHLTILNSFLWPTFDLCISCCHSTYSASALGLGGGPLESFQMWLQLWADCMSNSQMTSVVCSPEKEPFWEAGGFQPQWRICSKSVDLRMENSCHQPPWHGMNCDCVAVWSFWSFSFSWQTWWLLHWSSFQMTFWTEWPWDVRQLGWRVAVGPCVWMRQTVEGPSAFFSLCCTPCSLSCICWWVASQVWSLAQVYSVCFLQSSIVVKKCVFYKHTIKVWGSFFNTVLGPLRSARAFLSLWFWRRCTRRGLRPLRGVVSAKEALHECKNKELQEVTKKNSVLHKEG